jgi:hypothetical protein
LAPFYLLSGLGLSYIIRFAAARLDRFSFAFAAAVLAVVLASGAVNDYRNFTKMFIRAGIPDTAIRLLKESSRADYQFPTSSALSTPSLPKE